MFNLILALTHCTPLSTTALTDLTPRIPPDTYKNDSTLNQSKRKANIIEYSGNKSLENRRIRQEKLIGIKADTHRVSDARLKR